jgi:hypothetical protein
VPSEALDPEDREARQLAIDNGEVEMGIIVLGAVTPSPAR